MSLTQVITVGVNFTTTGSNIIVVASTASQIFLVGMGLIIAGATTISFPGQESTFGPFIIPAAGGSITLTDVYPGQTPYAEFPVGTALVISQTGAVQFSGFLRYSLG